MRILVSGGKSQAGRMTPLDQKWDSLASRLQAGDREAAFELIDKYYEQIYLFMRRLGHSRTDSEDLTQESFLQAWQHIGQLRSSTALTGWLYRIAANISGHWRRRYKADYAGELPQDSPAGNGLSSPEQAEQKEQLGRLTAAMSRLPIKLRQPVMLHYVQHLTIEEAAEALNLRPGTIKSRLNRALEKLRNELTMNE